MALTKGAMSKLICFFGTVVCLYLFYMKYYDLKNYCYISPSKYDSKMIKILDLEKFPHSMCLYKVESSMDCLDINSRKIVGF